MNDQLKNYLHDLVVILHQKYNETLTSSSGNEDEEGFTKGMNHAYFDTLDIIESQLKAFGYDVNQIGNITPDLSEKAKIK